MRGKKVKITKKKIEIFFLGIAVIVLAIFVTDVILNWKKGKSETKELLKWVKVSIIKIDNSIPPGMTIELKNTGPRAVGITHIRLTFISKDRAFYKNRKWSMVDCDLGSLKPSEKREVTLKCRGEDFSQSYRRGGSKKVRYELYIFPEWKESAEPLTGEIILQ